MLSNVFVLLFLIVMAIGGGASLISLFSPGWIPEKDISTGEIKWKGLIQCMNNDDPSTCKLWLKEKGYLRATLSLVCLAIIGAGAALCWSYVVCFSCCFADFARWALTVQATFAFLMSLAACITFGVANRKVLHITSKVLNHPVDNLGWAFVLSIFATVAYFVDILLAGVVVGIGDR